MKILILTNNAGGLYSFRKELLERLIVDGNVVDVALPYDEDVPRLLKIGCKVYNTPVERRGTNPFKDLLLLYKYISLIQKLNSNIILGYTIKPNIYGGMACRILNVPFLSNITGLGTALESNGLLQKMLIKMYRVALRKANMVFCQNQTNYEFLLSNHMISGKSKLIPGSGVNTDVFQYKEYPKDLQFIFVARVMKAKGIDQYLDMAKCIKKKFPDAMFHVCGMCEENYTNILQKLQNEGIIEYHGSVNNIDEYYSKCCCIVHPTYYPEGMSNVLLEACATGRPIITTNRPGCREIVDDGVNGFIVREKDSNDLINKTEKFLSLSYEERAEMGRQGRKKVEKEFNRQIVIEAYLEEINKIQHNNED